MHTDTHTQDRCRHTDDTHVQTQTDTHTHTHTHRLSHTHTTHLASQRREHLIINYLQVLQQLLHFDLQSIHLTRLTPTELDTLPDNLCPNTSRDHLYIEAMESITARADGSHTSNAISEMVKFLMTASYSVADSLSRYSCERR